VDTWCRRLPQTSSSECVDGEFRGKVENKESGVAGGSEVFAEKKEKQIPTSSQSEHKETPSCST